MKLEGLVIQNRFEEGDNFTASTFSAIGSKDGVEGYMLEPKGPSTEQPNQNQRIPEGIYIIDNYSSKKYPDNFILYNEIVPKERAILYHTGNTGNDTVGCNFLGERYDNGFVSSSKGKFNELKAYFDARNLNNIRIIISNKIQ